MVHWLASLGAGIGVVLSIVTLVQTKAQSLLSWGLLATSLGLLILAWPK